MEPTSSRSLPIVLICSFLWGCYSSNQGGEPGDGEIDVPGEYLVQDDLIDS